MKTNKDDLLIKHLFDAPREMVFDAWTNPEHLKHWYAPDGCTIEFKSIDVKSVGGSILCFTILYMEIAGLWGYIKK